jgi:hypothetical protein
MNFDIAQNLKQPLFATCLLALLVAAGGCGDSASEVAGSTIIPHLAPVSFGERYAGQQPYEWVLLLRSTGGQKLKIDEICLVGDEEDGSDVAQFVLEVEDQELPATVEAGGDFGVRLTYQRQEPNAGDDADQVAVVVQSNASNFPTLVIPVCARVVADGAERAELECQSPVTVEAGESAPDLCG